MRCSRFCVCLVLATLVLGMLVLVLKEGRSDSDVAYAETVRPPGPPVDAGPNAASVELGLPDEPGLSRRRLEEPREVPEPAVQAERKSVLGEFRKDLDAMSLAELQALHDSLLTEVTTITHPKLLELVRLGYGELLSTNSKEKYKVQKEDYEAITMVVADPTRGLLRAVLPRNGNEDAYELHDLRMAVIQLIKEKEATSSPLNK